MPKPAILLADNDEVFLQNAQEFLENRGYQVYCASNPFHAREVLEQIPIAIAILDYRLIDDNDERDKSGLELARATMTTNPVPKIILTKYDRYAYAVESLRPFEGGRSAIVDFVVKQDGLDSMLDAIKQILSKARIFLCYARPDEEKVVLLYEKLSVAGFVPWIDKKCIAGGERWKVAIRRVIRTADFFLVCLSKNSVNRRGFMQREISLALDIWDEKLEDDIYLIPVRLEDCNVVHERVRELQWVDLFEPGGFQHLCQAIRTGMRRSYQNL
jgi:ActR/RegA family two-component response regulator